MSAMVMEKRSKRDRASNYVPCDNRCGTGKGEKTSQDLGRALATHYAVIVDRRVPLCSNCARNWARWWDEAHDSVETPPEVLAA